MNKVREVMKALNVAKIIIDGQIDMVKNPSLVRLIAIHTQTKAENVVMIPYWCWRQDKPELDKRRYRRYQRSLKCLSHTVISLSDTSVVTEGVVSVKLSNI